MITRVNEPVFVVGAERSGTTMLRLMLAGHPKIGVCSEFEYVVDPLVDSDEWPEREVFWQHLRADWIFRAHAFEIDESLDYASLCRSFLDQTQQRDNAEVVVAVVHRNFDQLKRIWPEARYIHIVRDPRDVARSCIGMGWAGNVFHGVERWIEAERAWDAMRASLRDASWTEVVEERLVLDAESSLRQLCSFIGVPYDEGLFAYVDSTTYARPNPDLVEQWRRKLSHRDVALVENRVGNLLAARGYEPSGYPTVNPSAVERLKLRVGNKLGRVRHRIRSIGLWLYLQDWFSRKLRLQRWQDRLEPRLYEAWRAKLK